MGCGRGWVLGPGERAGLRRGRMSRGGRAGRGPGEWGHGVGVEVAVPRRLRSRGRRARGGARVTGLESSSSRAEGPGTGTRLTVREGLAVAMPARGGALVVRSGLGSGPRGRSCSHSLGCC